MEQKCQSPLIIFLAEDRVKAALADVEAAEMARRSSVRDLSDAEARHEKECEKLRAEASAAKAKLEQVAGGLEAAAALVSEEVQCVSSLQEQHEKDCERLRAAEAAASAAAAAAAAAGLQQLAREDAEREFSSMQESLLAAERELAASEALVRGEVGELEREVADRQAEAESLRASVCASEARAAEAEARVASAAAVWEREVANIQMNLNASESLRLSNESRHVATESGLLLQIEIHKNHCVHLQKEIDAASEAAHHLWGRLESTDNLLQILASRAAESESLLSSLESINIAETQARSKVEQELVNARAWHEKECKRMQADASFLQQELDRVTKELFDSNIALQNASVEIARCSKKIDGHLAEEEKARAQIAVIQSELAHSDRRCVDLVSEVSVANAKLSAVQQLLSSTQSELSEVRNQFHQYSHMFSSEIQCARQELSRTRAALVSSDTDACKPQPDIAQAELVSVQAVHRSEVQELRCQIETLQRDVFSAMNLAELNYKSGVRVVELENQLSQVLRTLRVTESLLKSSEAIRNGFV